MKKFLTSVFFAASAALSFACGPYWMSPVDLRSLYNVTPSRSGDVNYYTSVYWTNYNEIGATESDLNKLIAEGSQAIETSVNPIAKALRQKGNKEDIEYFKILCDYYAKGGVDFKKLEKYGDWYYPTKEEYKNWGAKKEKLLQQVEGYSGERLADRYAYTAMKIYFDNLDLDGANGYINSHKKELESMKGSPLYDMCRSLYAGILFRTGADKKTAAEIYAEIGDVSSLVYMDIFEDDILSQIESVWSENKNSPLLPYLLERAVSHPNSQASAICEFANRAAADSGCKNPQVWKCAAAAIHANADLSVYSLQDAQQEIQQAAKLKGSVQSAQTTRILDFYIKSLNQKEWTKEFASSALDEYKWIATLGEKGNNALAAITLNGIIPLLERSGKKSVAGLLSLRISQWEPNYVMDAKLDFSSNHYIEIMDAEDTEKMFQKPSSPDKFTAWVYESVNASLDERKNEIDEYIGTKYLREGNFARAEEFFSRLEDTFCYENRMYTVARWFKSENIVNSYKSGGFFEEEQDFSYLLTGEQKAALEKWGAVKNKKLRYCKDIQALLKDYADANNSGSAKKYELAYKLAVLYDQASFSGYCWYLRQYERGSWRLLPSENRTWKGEEGGELSLLCKNPFYFENEAKKYLSVAAESPDTNLSYKAKYALLFISYDESEEELEALGLPSGRRNADALKRELSDAMRKGLLSGEMSQCDYLSDHTSDDLVSRGLLAKRGGARKSRFFVFS